MKLSFTFVAFVLLVRVSKARQNLTRMHFENGNSISKEKAIVEDIKFQKRILEQYAIDHRFPNIQFYVDDGYSGASFNRPDFQRMMSDMEDGKIGIIITKDYCAIIGLNQKDLENQGILA